MDSEKKGYLVISSFIIRILIFMTTIFVLFFVVSNNNVSASEKEDKKKQIEKIETELSIEKEKYLQFGIKEVGGRGVERPHGPLLPWPRLQTEGRHGEGGSGLRQSQGTRVRAGMNPLRGHR